MAVSALKPGILHIVKSDTKSDTITCSQDRMSENNDCVR